MEASESGGERSGGEVAMMMPRQTTAATLELSVTVSCLREIE